MSCDRSNRGRFLTVLFAMTLLVGVLATSAASASAATPGVSWSPQSLTQPTNFEPGDDQLDGYTADGYTLSLTNLGEGDSSGTITLVDTLPAGVTTLSTPEVIGEGKPGGSGRWQCTEGAGNSVVTCTSAPGVSVEGLTSAHSIDLYVQVAPGTPPGPLGANVVQVSGGGAPECGAAGQLACPSASSPTVVAPQTPPFGLIEPATSLLNDMALADTQAGDHPAVLTSNLDVPTSISPEGGSNEVRSVEPVKRIVVDLPAALVGNPQAAPQCTLTELLNYGKCAPATQVGVLHLLRTVRGAGTLPIFNMVPEHGYPAEFGIYETQLQAGVLLYASVRPGPDYGVRITSQNLPTFPNTYGFATTFWGNPAGKDSSPLPPLAFLTNSADCAGGASAVTIHAESWEHPGREVDGEPDFSDPNWKSAAVPLAPVTGCESLHFDPSIALTPESVQSGSPSGYMFDLSMPQDEQPEGLAASPVRRATVTLPEGLSLSPSAADGLQGCSDEQFDASATSAAGCPLASQVATVTARTPILSEPVQGQVFVGSPDCSPCSLADAQEGRLLRLFLQVQIPGASLKFPGTVSVNPVTGQLSATFPGLLQQPVSDIQVQFKGGPRAPLANPRTCGVFTTTSDLEPWSHQPAPGEALGTADGTPSSSFGTTGCGNPGQFAPGFVAGTSSNQAGAFSPFSVSLSRTDQDQELSGATVTTPPGLLGTLKGVERCPEPGASQGACGAGSLIGHATATAGPGSHPFDVQGGEVFLTGPYKGAPFGLSIVVPAVAGPFNLGSVVVRAAIGIDPHTAQITVSSDPLPSMLDGIPLQVKSVNVSIDRAGLMFNPTSCEPMSVGGTLTSTQGASASVSSRFQAAGCAALAFKPVFRVSTQAKTSKQSGASLTVKGSFPAVEANIHSVAVTLPKQLPARLTTIQQACPEATFNANPAGCPAGSDIGIATATTPILASPVTGPAYLVSHGGAAFPDVVAILQGEGVTVDLTGSIDIKKGITSSDFATIPDAPISNFQLTLPEGPHSGLAAVLPTKAKGNMCGTSLTMPFTITGQNGAQLKQNIKIAVTGCPKPKKKKAKAKHTKKGNTQRAHGKKG